MNVRTSKPLSLFLWGYSPRSIGVSILQIVDINCAIKCKMAIYSPTYTVWTFDERYLDFSRVSYA